MGNTRYSGLTVATAVNDADQWGKNEAGTSKSMTASLYRAYATGSLTGFSTGTESAAYSTDTYLQGSAVFAPAAGAWKAGTRYHLRFSMAKTAAGVAASTLIIRMGTLGTTGDAAICTQTFGAGTAVADIGVFEVWAHLRTVGAGTAAVLVAEFLCTHQSAGLMPLVPGIGPIISSGFNSTTQTVIGASFNGGASFSGTSDLVQAEVLNL